VTSIPSSDFVLLREAAFVDGVWIDADDRKSIVVKNPADGKKLGFVPFMGAEETARAIAAAHKALPAWRARTAKERSAVLMRFFNLIMKNQEDLARLLTAEQGKPLAEARSEIGYAASFIEWFAEEAKRVYGETIPPHLHDKRILIFKQPVGVVGAVTPWNFPAAMVTRKIGPALAAGCTLVLKPASQTPFSALALAALGAEAGLPSGVLNVVTGNASAIGGELVGNPAVRKISFTGSTEIGKQLAAACAATVKRVTLELGGNAPFIVFEDADLDAAVEGAIASKFRNTGQTCVCANRILVSEQVYNRFAKMLAARVRGFRIGAGLDGPTEQGPLINSSAVAKVEEHVADALELGGKIVTGGRRVRDDAAFFQPTVITGARAEMKIAQEETFGPVAALFPFKTEEDAVALSNATEFGLASYFYTRDYARLFRVAEQLEYGIVGANTGLISTEVAPFGGVKQSGWGREGSRYGIEDYLDIKYVCVGL
jgi:succinate-semialdehyde dehydrogenase/glutarate-semialdehyde dehydrogenase